MTWQNRGEKSKGSKCSERDRFVDENEHPRSTTSKYVHFGPSVCVLRLCVSKNTFSLFVFVFICLIHFLCCFDRKHFAKQSPAIRVVSLVTATRKPRTIQHHFRIVQLLFQPFSSLQHFPSCDERCSQVKNIYILNPKHRAR